MKISSHHGITSAVALLVVWAALDLNSVSGQTTFVQTGAGTNRCRLVVGFSTGEQVFFQHRWDGLNLNAKFLLESVVAATGGELLVSENDYHTPFALVPMANQDTFGLVVHYQGSYEVPYINAIRWNGPEGLVNADYFYPDGWWHLWVQGPARVDQSYAWPEPLAPVDLAANSAWFFGEFSGLADLTLADGASIGLVYGNTSPPSSLPAPAIQSVLSSQANTLQIRFSTVPGARYQLETRTDLSAGSWSPAGEPVTATTRITTVTTSMNSPSGRAFYRIALLP